MTPTTVYAGTSGGGVFESTNSGGSWSAVNTGLIATLVQALAIDPLTPTTIYAGTSGGVFKSTQLVPTPSPTATGSTPDARAVIERRIDARKRLFPASPAYLYGTDTFFGSVAAMWTDLTGR